ncbi:MAG TPA: Cof-type HAD-IIB family hydrolase [Gaiellaceae bacterium]|nr:Cof-type HAD-IIB family hydrolase [Gaiellaceae bacterium]
MIATDLDRTLISDDYVLRPRTLAAIARARAAGIRVIVVTGRMVQSARRVLAPAEMTDPLVCYQGAAVVDADGTWLLHEPIELELAREAIAAVEERGFGLNVYVDDELYVAEVTPEAERYSLFQKIPLHTVGDLASWLSKPPTKLVCIGDPVELDELRMPMQERFEGRLWVTKSLPFFLEFAADGVSKGSGLDFLAERVGFSKEKTICFGDGENDLDLMDWGAFGIAVENADARVKALSDWVCPPVSEEGVARVIEAVLDSGT